MSKVPDGWGLRCIGCGRRLTSDPRSFTCPNCGDILEIIAPQVSRSELFPFRSRKPGVWRYSPALPIVSEPVTLDEGGTPLLRSAALGQDLGLRNLYFKVEGQNPTGSFKDRGMTVAVTRARDAGGKVLVCASTGNTAASLSAYAARAGLKSSVVLPSGKVAAGKLMQAIAHGARLVQVDDGFDLALKILTEAVTISDELYLLNSINPYRIEGQKTVAFEIFEQLGRVPDFVVLPVGNAGNISAVWKGFRELRDWGIVDRTPKLIGIQAEGASPLAQAFLEGREKLKLWKEPETVATAIRIGNPVSWKKALTAIKESGGRALAVSDAEILSARRKLASKEGTFVENASASPLAGISVIEGEFSGAETIVCILTGHGLKDKLPRSWKVRKPPVAGSSKDLVRLLVG